MHATHTLSCGFQIIVLSAHEGTWGLMKSNRTTCFKRTVVFIPPPTLHTHSLSLSPHHPFIQPTCPVQISQRNFLIRFLEILSLTLSFPLYSEEFYDDNYFRWKKVFFDYYWDSLSFCGQVDYDNRIFHTRITPKSLLFFKKSKMR